MNQDTWWTKQQGRVTTCPRTYICCPKAILNATSFHSQKWTWRINDTLTLEVNGTGMPLLSRFLSQWSESPPICSLSQKPCSLLRHFRGPHPNNQFPTNPSDFPSPLHPHGHWLSSEPYPHSRTPKVEFHSVPLSYRFQVFWDLNSAFCYVSPLSAPLCDHAFGVLV